MPVGWIRPTRAGSSVANQVKPFQGDLQTIGGWRETGGVRASLVGDLDSQHRSALIAQEIQGHRQAHRVSVHEELLVEPLQMKWDRRGHHARSDREPFLGLDPQLQGCVLGWRRPAVDVQALSERNFYVQPQLLVWTVGG